MQVTGPSGAWAVSSDLLARPESLAEIASGTQRLRATVRVIAAAVEEGGTGAH
jgi:hypothetical protein